MQPELPDRFIKRKKIAFSSFAIICLGFVVLIVVSIATHHPLPTDVNSTDTDLDFLIKNESIVSSIPIPIPVSDFSNTVKSAQDEKPIINKSDQSISTLGEENTKELRWETNRLLIEPHKKMKTKDHYQPLRLKINNPKPITVVQNSLIQNETSSDSKNAFVWSTGYFPLGYHENLTPQTGMWIRFGKNKTISVIDIRKFNRDGIATEEGWTIPYDDWNTTKSLLTHLQELGNNRRNKGEQWFNIGAHYHVNREGEICGGSLDIDNSKGRFTMTSEEFYSLKKIITIIDDIKNNFKEDKPLDVYDPTIWYCWTWPLRCEQNTIRDYKNEGDEIYEYEETSS